MRTIAVPDQEGFNTAYSDEGAYSAHEDSIDQFDVYNDDDAYSVYESLVDRRDLATKKMACAIASLYKPAKNQQQSIWGNCVNAVKELFSNSDQQKVGIVGKKIKIVKGLLRACKTSQYKVSK